VTVAAPPPSRAPLRFRKVRYGMLTLLMLSIAGVALCGVLLAINDGHGDSDILVNIMITSGVTLLAANVGLLCVIRIAEAHLRGLMWATLAFTSVVAASWIAAVWTEWIDHSGVGEIVLVRLWSLTIADAGLVIVGQLLAAEVASVVLRSMRRIAAAWVAVFTMFSVQLFWTEWWWPWDEFIGLITVAAAVLTIVGLWTLGLAGKKRTSPVAGALESIESTATLRLTCPHCQREQTLPSGLTRCRGCRRALLIQFEEPRCECGYLLFKLVGETCPECGRHVPCTAAPGLPTVPVE